MTEPGAVVRRSIYGRAWRCACPEQSAMVGNLVPGKCPRCGVVPTQVGLGVRVEEAPPPPAQAAEAQQQQTRHG